MSKMSATEARNNIGKLWEAAAEEPVTVESMGKPIAVVMSPEAYAAVIQPRRPRQAGTMRYLLAGVDVNALLSTPIDDVFAEYQ